MSKLLTEKDFHNAAKRLRCEISAIKAVAEVESKGNAFYADGFPVILFERHKFRQFTQGRYNNSHPHLSGPAGNYGKAGQNQRNKFNEAFALSPNAAMKSCSWGRYQIMGFNHEVCGFTTVGKFVDAMKESEGAQLDAFISFVENNNLVDELRAQDWAAFAKGYNGKDYKKNNYDVKMANAYRKFKNQKFVAPVSVPSIPGAGLTASDEPAEIPAEIPEADVTNKKGATVQVADTIVNQGNQQNPPVEKELVAVEKPEKIGFASRMWKKIIGVFGGGVAIDGVADKLQQAQAFGFTSDFWERLLYLALLGGLVYLAVQFYQNWKENRRNKEITQLLVESNSTPENIVRLVDTEDIPKLEKLGYKIVRR